MNARSLTAFMIAIAFASSLTSCSEEKTFKDADVRALAQRFYDAAAAMDTKRMLEIVTYPFQFDDTLVQDESELKVELEKHWREVNLRVQVASYISTITYEDFVDGKEFMGVKRTREKAQDQAKRANFVAGSLLVRCYHADKETRKEDGRGYYLVVRETNVGLKISSYYD